MFVETYVTTRNAALSAATAGYAKGDPTAASARNRGSELMQLLHVKAAVAVREAELAETHRLRTHEVFRTLAAIVHAKPTDYVWDDKTERWTLAPGVSEDAWLAVAGMEGPRLKLWDKNPALKNAMQNLNLLTEKVDVTTNGMPLGVVVLPAPTWGENE